jgi:Tfp pilus assembly protein PilX
MNRAPQKGIALILTLILLFVLSVMAVSLMFISQTETWSSLNYRLMSQARDGAEAGINSAANYIVNTYTQPGAAGDPTSAYNTTVSPVQNPSTATVGHDVILSAMSSQASNYPVSSVQTAFNTSGVGYGSIAAGNTTVNYNTYATLLSMPPTFKPFGSTTNTTVQTWQIVSDGTISTIRNAKVQVSAILEKHRTPTFNYAAFATDNGCGALNFGGGGNTNSYDSSAALSGGLPVTSATFGNVGTNGNLATSGNPTTINGTLSTPRTGVGTCTAGNVTAWSASSGHVTNGLVELPQPVVYPVPTIPAAGTVDITSNSSCPAPATMTTTGGTCTAGAFMTLAPAIPGGTMSLHTLSLTGNTDLHLAAGTYNIDSLTETGNTALVLDSVPVILNVTGSAGGTVVKLTGGGLVNTTGNFDPTTFQILYAGTGTVNLMGGAQAVGLLYAPNASFSFAGGANWYGAVIGAKMTDFGGAAVHYDRRLQNKDFTVGPWMLDSFTWKKD